MAAVVLSALSRQAMFSKCKELHKHVALAEDLLNAQVGAADAKRTSPVVAYLTQCTCTGVHEVPAARAEAQQVGRLCAGAARQLPACSGATKGSR